MNNQPQHKKEQNLLKPKVLIILLIFVIIQLGLIITLVILQAVYGYIGFEKAIQKINISGTCTSIYLNYKFSNHYVQYQMSISFILTCCATLFCLILLIMLIKPFVRKSDQSPNLYRHINDQQKSGTKLSRVWYLIQSLMNIMIAVTFGYYLTYYIQIPVSCYSQTVKNQILIITIIAGVSLLFGLISWIIILCIIHSLGKATQQILNQKKYQDKFSNGPNNKQIQMQKYSSGKKSNKQSDKNQNNQQLQSARKINPINVNETKEPFLDKSQERSDQYRYRSPQHERKNQSNEQNFQQGYNRTSIVKDKDKRYASRKDIYQTPYSRISKQYYQPQDSPKQSYRRNQGLYNQTNSRFDNSPSKNKFRQEELSYIGRNNNRIPHVEQRTYEGNRNRLHSTYFRNDDSIPKAKYTKTTSRKKGILSDYIHGQYK